MPTLLRLTIAGMALVVLLVGAVVLASGTPEGGALAGGAFALSLLVLPALVVGTYASYWSQDAGARRRLRIWSVALGIVQVAGAVWLLTTALPRPAGAAPAIGLVAASLVLDVASVLVGRAARRAELLREPSEDDGTVRAAIRRGWRRAAIGGVLGLAIGIAGTLALGSAVDDPAFVWRLVPFGGMTALLGTEFGVLSVTLGLAPRIRDLLGREYSSSRRIGRAIAGKDEPLSEDEAQRAARYAAIAPGWLRLQLLTQVCSALVSVTLISNMALQEDGPRWLLPVVGALLVVSVSTVAIGFGIRLARMRRYSDAHPAPAG